MPALSSAWKHKEKKLLSNLVHKKENRLLLQWPKSRIWTTPSIDKCRATSVVGIQNGTTTLEDRLAVSYKTKHALTIQSSNHTLWYLCKGVKNITQKPACGCL